MRTDRPRFALAITTASVLILGACSGTAPASTQGGGASPVQGGGGATDTLTVSLVSPFSADLAQVGDDIFTGLSLALQTVNYEVNGHKIVIEKIDDQCKPDVAVTEVSKILDTAQIIAGPACSGNTLAVQDAVAEAQIPLLNIGLLSAPSTKGQKNLFQIPAGDRITRAGFIQWAKQNQNVTSWALLHDTSGYGSGAAEVFNELAPALGATISAQVNFNPGEQNFTGILTNLDNSGVDAIALLGFGIDIAQITKQAKQQGMKTPIYGDLDYSDNSFLDAAAGSAEGQYFVTYYIPDERAGSGVASLMAAAKAAGATTTGETADGYVTGLVIIDALKRIDGPVNKANLLAALPQVNIADSPEGPVSFGPDGTRFGTNLTIIGRIVDGKPTFIARV